MQPQNVDRGIQKTPTTPGFGVNVKPLPGNTLHLSKMQFLAIITLAATAVLALPSGIVENRNYPECKPAQYSCNGDKSGWLVCNVDEKWLVGGVCPKGTTCTYIHDLPYCT
ncbi:hypothetical protein PG987_011075 [Apiospora arundinis]